MSGDNAGMDATLTSTMPQTPPVRPAPEAPATIGRFAVLGEIGRGANGVVYAATDPVLAREVAIKAVPVGPNAVFGATLEESFLREAKSAGRMSHPNIVTVFDAGRAGELAYIAMERLYGKDLHVWLDEGARPSSRQAATIIMRVADAVHHAHKRGLVHRDLKPSNIFLARDGQPKLLDFGVAAAAAAGASARAQQLIGTPNYMSPEQAEGRPIDSRSDVFSLGTILYEMLSGTRAFDGGNLESTLLQVQAANPVSIEKLRPQIAPELAAIVKRALARDPGRRFQSAADLRDALGLYLEHTKAPATSAAPIESGRRRVPTWLAVALTGTLVGGLAWWWWPAPPEPRLMLTPEAAAPAPPPPAAAAPEPVTEPAPSASAGTPPPAASAASRAAPARGEAAPRAAALTDGVVQLAVSPWAEVLVDGRVRGVTPPLTELEISPGRHVIELRNPGAEPVVRRIEVRAGEKVRIQHRFGATVPE